MGKIQCPSCHSTNVEKTTRGTVTEKAAQVTARVGVSLAKSAAKSYGVPGTGHIPTGKTANLLAAQLVSVQHVCKDCYQIFSAKVDTDGEARSVTLDSKYSGSEIREAKEKVIAEKDELYQKAKGRMTIHIVLAVLSVIYTVCCYAYPAAIVVGLIICCCFIFAAVSKNNEAQGYENDAEKYRKMSLKEYRYKYM